MQTIVYRVLASPRFFYGLLALTIFQAAWVAFSAVYPMAFDEDFHLGIIKIYADQWSPFLAAQPPGADAFGAVARDPSYLFHYLMSFPYRFAALFTDSQTAIVIVLRLINVALFAGALVVWRRVLGGAGLSSALANTVLLLFTLIPIVPLLAGQINYDNLLFLLVAWACLLSLHIIAELRQARLPVLHVWAVVVISLFASLVKYAALPIFAAILLYLVVYALWRFRQRRVPLWSTVADGWRRVGVAAKLGLAALTILGGGLFFERYGLNAIQYGNPIPDCGQVLTVEQCMHYGPWGRDYRLAQEKDPNTSSNPIFYGLRWAYGMWFRLFFMINGNVPMGRYQNYPPLPIIGPVGMAVLLAGIGVAVAQWRAVSRKPVLVFFATLTVVYVASLWLQNYQMFLETGIPVAVNGRYLLLVMIPAAAVCALAMSWLLRLYPRARAVLATLVVLAFLQGGLVSFIVRADASWYWPNTAVQHINTYAKDVLNPLVWGDREPVVPLLYP